MLMTFITNVLSSLPSNKDLLVFGDFNFPNIDWDILSGIPNHLFAFCNTVRFNMCLLSLLKRLHGNILDLIVSTNDGLVQDTVIYHDFAIGFSSDHFIITFRVSVSNLNHIRAPCKSFPRKKEMLF